MKNTKKYAWCTTALLACAAANVQAAAQAPSAWWLHAGPVSVQFDTQASVRLGGALVPGASIEASSNVTLGAEIGYDLTPQWAARLTLGVPPTTKLTGTGPLAGAGELGRLKYGPAVLSVTWSFDGPGSARPYIGAGINYTIVLVSKGGAISSLDAKSAFGSVVQAGFDVPINTRWGVFFDVKKIFLKTSATGLVGPNAAAASAQLDPLLIHAGVGYRF